MKIQRTFKSGNTMRVSVPRYIRRALDITMGDYLGFEVSARGIVTLTNITRKQNSKGGKNK